ncbi:MAG: C4-dicarboxylate ABC transporter permease [Spirochaetae bacterium HGW-Spirochaetae-7]|nr:MAG: C4-dicarboxylate ABC transporter permease [Spirochaetae bacterium HGW-Spirochaetae-7]
MLISMVSFIVLLLIGVPIAFSLGTASLLFLVSKGITLGLIAQRMFTGIDVFPFMAIPFFVLAGELMNSSGITTRLVNLASIYVGRLRGGLGHVNIVASMFFAGITGSAVADTSALGSMLIPAMVEEGFDEDFSAAVTCSSSVIGPIIPPSIPFVVYSLVGSTSVAALFLAGMFPGILLGFSLMVVNAIISKRRNYPRAARWPTFKEIVSASIAGIVPMMMPLIILGGILGGIFTATEASAVAVVYALVIGLFVYKKLNGKKIKEAFLVTAKTSGVVFLVIACSNVFNWALVTEEVPMRMALYVAEVFTNKYMLLLAINVVLLIIGTFMEGTAALIILVPILLTITKPFGIEPVMLGAIVVLNLMIGLITPPVGLCLYVVCGITKLSIEKVSKAVMPFLAAEIVTLMLVTYFEPLSLFLPRLFGYVK